MKNKINPINKLTIIFLLIAIMLFAVIMSMKAFVLPSNISSLELVNRIYLLIGFSSLLLIGITFFIFLKAKAQMPIYFLMLTVFKLGVFIILIVSEENLPFNVRVSILVPILVFLILEKLYAYFLFQKVDEKKTMEN